MKQELKGNGMGLSKASAGKLKEGQMIDCKKLLAILMLNGANEAK
jgi:hypothetical protein